MIKKAVFFQLKSEIEEHKHRQECVTAEISKDSATDLLKHCSTTLISNNEKLNIPVFQSNSKIFEQSFYPLQTDIPCFYCRQKFETCPLGLPIKYHPERSETVSVSLQTGYKFKVMLSDVASHSKQQGVSKIFKAHFDCDGIYCSFNCMLADIHANPTFATKDSKSLIFMLYRMIHKCSPKQRLERSSDWRSLNIFGGEMTNAVYNEKLERIDLDKVTPEEKQGLMSVLNQSMKPMARMFQYVV